MRFLRDSISGSGSVRALGPEPGPPDVTDGDARVCQRIVARYARTFWLASHLLPAPKRRAAYAIYATCRTADDIVDVSGLRGRDSLDALRRFRDEVFQAMAARSSQPILRELARACHDFEVPDEALRELFTALAGDVTDREYETWDDLERYCQGVAGSVGEMCCAIFGAADDTGHRGAQIVTAARTLGVAMQLTNILRDVGEDARRGRCYLPTRELAVNGLDRQMVLSGVTRGHWDAWRAFMTHQVDRARDLYRQAVPAIPLLQRDAQRCAAACAMGYSRILDAIEAADYDTFSQRVSASRLTLLAVAWNSWRNVPLETDADRQASDTVR